MLLLLLIAIAVPDDAKIAAALDAFHQAAAKADEKAYFGLLTENAIFLGTDATERWTREEFRKFCKPYFDKGKGWLYEPRERHVTLSADGKTAWFDELLDSKSYGVCRGSGVLAKDGEAWKIAQYNLSIPIPNDAWPKIKPLLKK